MRLLDYMNKGNFNAIQVAYMITEVLGGDDKVTSAAVLHWAHGRRMPKAALVEAIAGATYGNVLLQDHHDAFCEQKGIAKAVT